MNELALCLINENTERFPYKKRCEMARWLCNYRWNAMRDWLRLLSHFARDYESRFEHEPFKPSEILSAAAEVADYYERHVAEMDAAWERARRKANH